MSSRDGFAVLGGWGFPKPYPGELGYGALARFFASWGHLDHRGLLRQVAGANPNSSHPLSVPALPALSRAAYPHAGDSAGLFIGRHTLLPYVLAFDEPSFRSEVLFEMRSNVLASASKLLSTSRLCGMLPETLQLCPECMLADQTAVGEPYWHTLHQLPGMFHCLRHGCRLHATRIAFQIDHSIRAVTPSQAGCRFDSSSAVVPRFSRKLERKLVLPTLVALTQRNPNPCNGKPEHYRSELKRIGFGSQAQTLETSRFERSFCAWLLRQECDPRGWGTGRWWLPLITKVQGRATTIQHLLLRAYIGSLRPEPAAAAPTKTYGCRSRASVSGA